MKYAAHLTGQAKMQMTKTPVLDFKHLNFGFVSHLLLVEPTSPIIM